jgi:hypothetical protein
MNPNPYWIELDLGQSNDYTALAIVETVGNDGCVTHRRSQRRTCTICAWERSNWRAEPRGCYELE